MNIREVRSQSRCARGFAYRWIASSRRCFPNILQWFARAGAIALSLVLVTSLSASADEAGSDASNSSTDLKQLSLEQLGNIEVTTVSKEPEKVMRTPAAIYVLTQEDIRRSGATSIPEALQMVPGVEVARIDSDTWAVGIRGFEGAFSKSVLVLIDGRSVYTPLFEGVYWDVQNVMLEDVDRIEVIRGPGGTIWGTNAVDGVINIITKNAKDTHGSLATAGGGNVNEGTGAARYGGSFHHLDYRFYGMGFNRGPELHSNNDPFDAWRMGQAGFRTDWQESERDAVTFQGDIYNGMDGSETNIAFFHPPSQANVDYDTFVSGGNLLARWKHQSSATSDFQIQTYFDRTNRQGDQYGETRDTFDVDFVHHIVLPKHNDFIWGLGIRLSPSYLVQTQQTVNFLPHAETDSIYSGFLQDEIPIVDNKVSLTIGTKLDHNNYSGFDYQPSVRVLWTPSDNQSFWAAVTRAISIPSRLDRDLQLTGYDATTVLPIFVAITGDPNYLAEKMLGYEAGYRSLITPKLYLDVSAFFNNYNDLTTLGATSLTLAKAPPPNPYIYALLSVPWANGLIGNTDGLEVAPNWDVTHWWQLKGSYSYLEMHFRDKAGITDANTAASNDGSSPHHQLVAQSLFNLPRGFEFDPTFRYVSALPAQTVKSYSTMDVHLGWHFREHVELSLVGQDLFRPSQIEYGLGVNNAPNVAIKRAIYGQITWTR